MTEIVYPLRSPRRASASWRRSFSACKGIPCRLLTPFFVMMRATPAWLANSAISSEAFGHCHKRNRERLSTLTCCAKSARAPRTDFPHLYGTAPEVRYLPWGQGTDAGYERACSAQRRSGAARYRAMAGRGLPRDQRIFAARQPAATVPAADADAARAERSPPSSGNTTGRQLDTVIQRCSLTCVRPRQITASMAATVSRARINQLPFSIANRQPDRLAHADAMVLEAVHARPLPARSSNAACARC